MDYKKKSLKKLNQNSDYEEIDTRLASGWYVDSLSNPKKKKVTLKPPSTDVTVKNLGGKPIENFSTRTPTDLAAR